MVYNAKQYDAAENFFQTGNSNVVNPEDLKRIQAYDLYENIFINSIKNLKIVLRGSDQVPILMPSGRKLIEATNRFLGVNLDFLVEGQGDAGTQDSLYQWWTSFFKREALKSKFESNKRWGLVRADAVFMLYGNENKKQGERISIAEVDPRQVFEIENKDNNSLEGYYVVEIVQDFRNPDDASKQIVKRRKFIKEFDENENPTGQILTEVTFWEIGKWDDRDPKPTLERVTGGPDEALEPMPAPISQLPIYIWNNNPPQNSSWGTSQLAGLETILYGINQSLTDEDATVVFQGLGMYMTNAAPPVDPNTGEITDWNIGPMQIIEVGTDQTFQRVSGIQDLSPYQDHIKLMDEKGLYEAAGIPEVAIGRVDVSVAESGISLKLQLMPLLAANAEKELHMITILDQMFHDITTMWLPAYELETFGDVETMATMSVVCVFDDPMPVDRAASIQETLLLQTSNLILTSMAIAKLRDLGWKYPTTDADGNALTDDDIAAMLNDQAAAAASAMDPFAGQVGGDLSAYDEAAGLEPPVSNGPAPGRGQGNTQPSQQSIPLNSS